jgi:hypothetical protein
MDAKLCVTFVKIRLNEEIHLVGRRFYSGLFFCLQVIVGQTHAQRGTQG